MSLAVDLETFSPVDLKKCGVYKYASHPDFEILLFAWSLHKGPVQIIEGPQLYDHPYLIDAVLDPLVLKTAYNAQFERVCIDYYYKLKTPIRSWQCTAVKASSLGLPGHLDGVASVLGLSEQKDSRGKQLIRYFCMPCKPTKTNGGRTRNLKEHDPEKWEQFKKYCIQDVVVEQAIRDRLEVFATPDSETSLYHLDQEINDRGVQVDKVLVKHAMEMDGIMTERLTEEAIKITGLRNPNSLKQLKEWLTEETEEEIETLTKKTIPALLAKDISDNAERVLQIRQEMGKTSIQKYYAIDRSVMNDDRLRGVLQFYGGRTGRWAGRILQPQNLPKHLLKFPPESPVDDLGNARKLLLENDLDSMELCYGNVPATLSDLVRTALVPKKGYKFVIADFSAIEARIIAWFAGEQWRMDFFKEGGDIYKVSASMMFGVPIEKVDKILRAKGKISELACVAKGQKILTNVGLVSIENITLQHKVWDGENFVQHSGLIFKGFKKVITYEGLTATEDHLVWTTGEQRPVRFKEAATSGAHLLQSGDGRNPIRLGKNNISRKKMESQLARSYGPDAMHQLWSNSVDQLVQLKNQKKQRVPTMLKTQTNPYVAGQETNCSKTTMHKSKRQRFQKLWRAWNKIQVQIRNCSRSLYDKTFRATEQNNANRQKEQRFTLSAGELKMVNSPRKQSEQTNHRFTVLESEGVALRSFNCSSNASVRNVEKTNYSPSTISSFEQTEELERDSEKVAVYDLLNCGPNNRFTVSNVLVHNCGFQGSVGAIRRMDITGALKHLSDAEVKETIVNPWRAANPNIVQLWWDMGNAALKAVRDKVLTECNGVRFYVSGGILFMRLLSGRSLAYMSPRIEVDEEGREGVVFMGVDQLTKKWAKIRAYAGRWVENLIQATARDCLAIAMTKISKRYDIVFHVHDELIEEVLEDDEQALPWTLGVMGEEISWAPGMLLGAAGFSLHYYKKD